MIQCYYHMRLDNGLTRHGMDDLAYRHLNHTTIKYKDLVGLEKNKLLLIMFQ